MTEPIQALVIDHVAIIVTGEAAPEARRRLRAAGLTENSSAVHNGQGTSNVFYCFENLFVELLSVIDAREASESAGARLFLAERAERRDKTFPFGIALRPTPPSPLLPFVTWPFSPPGSTGWHAVPVAVSSDDLNQPLMFRAQRDRPPADWTDGRSGNLQRGAGFASIGKIEIALFDGIEPGDDLKSLADQGALTLGTGGPRLALTVLGTDGLSVGVLDLVRLKFVPC